MNDQAWMAEWDEATACVGRDFSDGQIVEAVEHVERSSIRRFIEPLELDCALHYDDEAARANGYEGIVAPTSALSRTFVDPGQWRPGDAEIFTSSDAHAAPQRPGVMNNPYTRGIPGPITTAAFATDFEIEVHRPTYVGDRLSSRGRTLLSCLPKETRVGKGAFMMFESRIFNQDSELVAVVRRGLYAYNPHSSPPRGVA